MRINRFRLMVLVLAMAALACQAVQSPVQPVPTVPPVSPPVQDDSPNRLTGSERATLISATVQIYALFNQNGELSPAWTGSGTILDPGGLILTNAHVAAPTTQGEPQNPDALGIALIQAEDKPPVVSYLAEVRAADGFLDLAVLQITSTIDGNPVASSSLNLPSVAIGNSDTVHVGDPLYIFGFPGIGGDTITFTDGNISGFTPQDPVGDRAWLKTDATIAGGNSGGLAANDSAQIIGVPTKASSGAEGNITDCRVVQDTNGDGQLTDADTCIPIGGFINAVRPINLAVPLIEAARAGKQYASPYPVPGVISAEGSGQQTLSNFVWLTSDSECNPGEPVDSYPAETLCVVPGFDYSGMTNGEPFREIWTHNGQMVGDFTYAWEWDAEGRFASYLSNDGDPLPDGVYSVEFFAGADQHSVGRAPDVTVGSGGGSSSPTPESSGDTVTVYGLIYDVDTGNPIPGVSVFVLSPGVTYDQWQSENFVERYVVVSLQTGSNGQYRITGIPRDTLFTIVFSVEGYYDKFGDNMQAGSDDPDQIELNVPMNK
ncbi:MAG TPA: trypsin-like peptidase domain-containing protein [Anaerolineales bacterium]|nr:trypsin-like peptidase domain-containing protein [Anaerolineales bacterium]